MRVDQMRCDVPGCTVTLDYPQGDVRFMQWSRVPAGVGVMDLCPEHTEDLTQILLNRYGIVDEFGTLQEG